MAHRSRSRGLLACRSTSRGLLAHRSTSTGLLAHRSRSKGPAARIRFAALVVVAALLAATTPLLAAAPGALAAARPRTSLTAVENDLMCVACHEPLAVSQSPEAGSERQLISRLIALGDTKAQIERVMVAQYGPSVLARPPASGFNLSVYILPPAAVLAGLAIVAFALTRWRRGKRGGGIQAAAAPPLSAGDARRLEEDLARYKG